MTNAETETISIVWMLHKMGLLTKEIGKATIMAADQDRKISHVTWDTDQNKAHCASRFLGLVAKFSFSQEGSGRHMNIFCVEFISLIPMIKHKVLLYVYWWSLSLPLRIDSTTHVVEDTSVRAVPQVSARGSDY